MAYDEDVLADALAEHGGSLVDLDMVRSIVNAEIGTIKARWPYEPADLEAACTLHGAYRTLELLGMGASPGAVIDDLRELQARNLFPEKSSPLLRAVIDREYASWLLEAYERSIRPLFGDDPLPTN